MKENANPSATKRGPGRYHVQGHKKASPSNRVGGTPYGFKVLHPSEERLARRALNKAIGHRQAKRARMAVLRAVRDAARA